MNLKLTKISIQAGFLIFFCYISTQIRLSAQTLVCLEITEVPKDTPENATIYVAGNFNNWNSKSEQYQLKKDSSGNWKVCFNAKSEVIYFKFTLGSWEQVESNTNLEDIDNRTLDTTRQRYYRGKIHSWKNLGLDAQKSTASPQVLVLEDSLWMKQLKRQRSIRLYLPPDYYHSKRNYPVLYMHDGQNLFDQITAYSQEWGVDEIMDSVYSQNIKNACIVVGIDNGESKRIDEYSPWKNPQYGGGEGRGYADFLVNQLKPFIDQHFRTKPQPRHTAILGSSMGGLISFYTALEYPNVFGKVGIFSPSFWFSDKIIDFIGQKDLRKLGHSQWYFLAGEKESTEMVRDCKKVYYTLMDLGIPRRNLKLVIKKDGKHQEWFWYREFAPALYWLGLFEKERGEDHSH